MNRGDHIDRCQRRNARLAARPKSKKTKRCNGCKQVKSRSDFAKFKSHNGKKYTRGTCKSCNNAKREKSRAEPRRYRSRR